MTNRQSNDFPHILVKIMWLKCMINNSKLGYLKDSNAAAHSVDTGISLGSGT